MKFAVRLAVIAFILSLFSLSGPVAPVQAKVMKLEKCSLKDNQACGGQSRLQPNRPEAPDDESADVQVRAARFKQKAERLGLDASNLDVDLDVDAILGRRGQGRRSARFEDESSADESEEVAAKEEAGEAEEQKASPRKKRNERGGARKARREGGEAKERKSSRQEKQEEQGSARAAKQERGQSEERKSPPRHERQERGVERAAQAEERPERGADRVSQLDEQIRFRRADAAQGYEGLSAGEGVSSLDHPFAQRANQWGVPFIPKDIAQKYGYTP